jgi:hypothetical protein
MTEYGSDDYGTPPPVNDDDPLGLLPPMLHPKSDLAFLILLVGAGVIVLLFVLCLGGYFLYLNIIK